ncbi:MAG: DUF3168 domain-containing protein [Alphaproteobacteria bacterium]
MSDPIKAATTAKAVHNRLSTDIGVQNLLGHPPRLYDMAPEDPEFPYLTYGDLRCEEAGGDGVKRSVQKTSLHVWSRYAGRTEVLDILAQISAAFEAAPLTLEGGETARCVVPYLDVLRAADGRTLHGVLRLNIYTCSLEDAA